MDRRDFLFGVTAAGAITTPKVAAAADIDTLVAQGIKVVPTMADLRAITPSSGDATVWLRGYHAPLDGGEGFLHWNENATEPDDGGTVITSNGSSTGRWRRAIGGHTINAKWFGVKGDGGTDNSVSLIMLRNFLRARRSRHYAVYFPPGHYQYTNNRWLFGVGSVTIQAYGVRFQCVHTGSWNANQRPLNTQSIWDEVGDVPEGSGKTFTTGDRFEDVEIGDQTITMLTTADATNFSAGDRVLLHGFDQQGQSFPPNLRYFQWNTIASVDAGTGVLTLDDSVRHTFRSDDWRDTHLVVDGGNLDFGKARVMKLERPNFFYPKYIEIVGAEFLNNPTGSSDDLIIAAENLKLMNVKTKGGVVPSENRLAIYENCAIDLQTEGDKIVDEAIFMRCEFRSAVDAATGINRLVIEDSVFYDCLLKVSPRRAYMRRNVFHVPAGEMYPPIQTYAAYSVEEFVCEENVIYHDGKLRAAIHTDDEKTFIVGSAGPSNEIRITGDDTNLSGVIKNILPGTLFFKDDMSDWGRVIDITHDGTDYVIAGTWLNTPSGDWKYCRTQKFREIGTIFKGGDRPIFLNIRAPQIAEKAGMARVVVLGTSSQFTDGWQRHYLNGYVRSIEARILKPYTGPSSGPLLFVELHDGSVGTTYLSLDAKKKGYAETRVDGLYSNPPAQFLTQLDSTNRTRYMTVYLRQGGRPVSGTLDQYPHFIVEVRVEPIE